MLTDELLREFQQSVCDWYPTVRDSILFYETEERRKAIEAITEVRDVLDHFWVACTATTEQEAIDYLADVRDHLRSAAVEPLERAVEERFAAALEAKERATSRVGILLRRTLMLPADAQAQAADLEELIKDHIRRGRSLKSKLTTAPQAVEEFKSAHRYTRELATLYSQHEVDGRKFDLTVATVVGLIIGVVATFVVRGLDLVGKIF